MTIASFQFLAFSLVVVLLYNASPAVAWRKWILLIADLLFLSTFSHNLVAFLPRSDPKKMSVIGHQSVGRA